MLQWLSDKDWVRLRIFKEKNRIVGFVVNYEIEVHGRRYAVVRYDTYHGYAHMDILKPNGSRHTENMPDLDYKALLGIALDDIRENWKEYRKRFEKWLRERK